MRWEARQLYQYKTMSETISIYETDTDEEIEVTGNFIAGCFGSRNEFGALNEPDDPSYWEIESAKYSESGVEVDLTRDQEREAEEAFNDLEFEY